MVTPAQMKEARRIADCDGLGAAAYFLRRLENLDKSPFPVIVGV